MCECWQHDRIIHRLNDNERIYIFMQCRYFYGILINSLASKLGWRITECLIESSAFYAQYTGTVCVLMPCSVGKKVCSEYSNVNVDEIAQFATALVPAFFLRVICRHDPKPKKFPNTRSLLMSSWSRLCQYLSIYPEAVGLLEKESSSGQGENMWKILYDILVV